MDHETESSAPVVSNRVMEIVVAGLFALFSIIVMMDSARVGAGWASDGPEAGYFPFYVGLIMLVSALAIMGTAIFRQTNADSGTFVEKHQLALVLQVLVPSSVFVALVSFLGIYVAAAIFIAFFMYWVGKYPVQKIVPVAVGVPVALFVAFEIWFLVPLPKGPVEAMLGF
ncbi:tripartite tricarboxylate transporter TctB family protein [Azospirillum halopraeferens]|uniref:tripartite tricarboxylate transporter TctB family protein n=1 Tax=Azospirillum halopraeferens TaxID=34010 RepID=UPI000418574D|nr:tripartite tricarboxylate transporter TctB family protein [Azospirillum halopraeferens]